MNKKLFEKNKHDFRKKFLLIVFLITLFPFSVFCEEEASYILKGPLAGAFYYTEQKPGRWYKLINSHKPILEIEGNILEVTTPHEMKGHDHFIIKHIIMDNKLNIISEKIFDPSSEIPVSKHNISGYTDRLFIISICNKHDMWLNIFNF